MPISSLVVRSILASGLCSPLFAALLAACSGGASDELNRETASGGRDGGIDSGSVEEPLDASEPQDASSQDALPMAEDSAPDTSSVVQDTGAEAAAAADAAFLPGALAPMPYLTTSDSPFADVQFSWFYREDFEDHLLNTLGLVSEGVLSSSFGASVVDSVDQDDGIPDDNRCIKSEGSCDAWWGPGSLTFSFDAQVLGALPTHVGAVWTDGGGQVSFEAFGADGLSIFKIGPFSEPGFPDDTINSSTAEDRFFGVYEPTGISAITVSNTSGGVEVDHVQYGRAP